MRGIVISCPIVDEHDLYRSFSPTDTITRLVLPEIPLTLTDYNGKILVRKTNDLDGREQQDEFTPTKMKEVEVPQHLVDLALTEFNALEEFRQAQGVRQKEFTAEFRSLESAEFPESWVNEQLRRLNPTDERAEETIRQMGYFKPITIRRETDSRPWWKFW